MVTETLSPEANVKLLNKIWMAMLASVGVYFLIGLVRFLNTPVLGERSQVANLIWLFALAFVASGMVMPKILFKGDRPQDKFAGLMVSYAFFETVVICALLNFFKLGVSFTEMTAVMLISFVLILIYKPRLA